MNSGSRSISHLVKRSATQVKHVIGSNHFYSVRDAEYESLRGHTLGLRKVMTNTRHYLQQLESSMRNMVVALKGVKTCFNDLQYFCKKDEDPVVHPTTSLGLVALDTVPADVSMKAPLQQEGVCRLETIAQRFDDFLATNCIQVLTAALALEDPLDNVHNEIRTLQADLEVLLGDAAQLRNSIELFGIGSQCDLSSCEGSYKPSKRVTELAQNQQQLEITQDQWRRAVGEGKVRLERFVVDVKSLVRKICTDTMQHACDETLEIHRVLGSILCS